LDCYSGFKAITGVLIRGRRRQERQRMRKMENTVLLALKTEGAMSQGMQAASRHGKTRKQISLGSSRRNTDLLTPWF
jgi:hypothetical protein